MSDDDERGGGGIEFTSGDMVVDIESAGLPDLGSRGWIDTSYTYFIKSITVHLRNSYLQKCMTVSIYFFDFGHELWN